MRSIVPAIGVEVNTLRMQVKDIEAYVNQSKNLLKQVEESQAYKNLNFVW